MKIKNDKLIVVLGMHRSGTSAITKSLEVLGVGLGDDLHPAGLDNPKGFWEDRECIEINESLLRHFGSAYDRLNLAWEETPKDARVSELRLMASQHVSRKLIENNGIWGFKDPRTCRLLNFWKEVFLTLACEVSLVIAVRNPASVAASLNARNKIPAEKAYFLWLQHVLPTLNIMNDAQQVVVDYDELLENPYSQIVRISTKLGLPIPDAHSPLVKGFENNFLESKLRHTSFTEAELKQDSRAPKIVISTYNLLHRLATDQESLESPHIQYELAELNMRLKETSPAFDYINALEDERQALWEFGAVRDGQIDAYRLQAEQLDVQLRAASAQIANINQTLTERDEQINAYRLQAEQLDVQLRAASTQIANINQTLTERDEQINAYRLQAEQLDVQLRAASTQIANINQTLTERDEQINAYRLQAEQLDVQLRAASTQIANINQTLTERDRQICAYRLQVEQFDVQLRAANMRITILSHTLKKSDGQIVNLNQELVDRDGQIAGLNQTVADRDQEIDALRRSSSWRLSKPFRFLSRLLGLKQPIAQMKRVYRKLTVNLDKLPDDFDRDMYLKLNPDLAASGLDPETHYVLLGCHEGRIYCLQEMNICGEHSQLPDDFDPDIYLKLNPDLVAGGVDPAIHYLLHGRQEGRAFSVPALDLCSDHDFKPERKTILIVSHEASLTGAPILSVNLVQVLVESYNVVALLLGGGPLSDAFRLSGAAVITSANLRGNPIWAHLQVSQLCKRFNFKFAVVNSIESRVVLPALGEYFVPAISLVHEFASYTRPRGAFKDTLFWSGEVVFSANVTMENAFVEYPDLVDRFVHILPQGRSLLPLSEFTEEQRQAESIHIRRLMRPKGLSDDTVIVLGAGFVHIRKGVDLFIECAARVHCAPGGEKCRFVWIGNGYDPDNDVGYSVYLADQIRRAGLQEHVFFIAETTAIETAYEEADLLLLSSRLDPLPNVAIDAMSHGLPVLCFNKTTGIADFLIDNGLGNYCVAEYIDSTNMAEKILALASSKVLREDVGEQCRVASIEYFNMKKYVARLDVLAQGICERTQQEQTDSKTILDSGLFRGDFSCSPYQQNQSIEDEVRYYVRAWASGISRRKPFPGFHPGIYQEQHGLAIQGADPFAEYLRAGRPEGPWNYPVIVAQEAASDNLPDNHRVALHLHIYYQELLPEIITRLACNRICPDLFISITNESARQWVISQLSEYRGKVVDIQLAPNRGRNIGPFLTAFSQGLLANYDFIGHIHTKKTVDVKDASMGETWRQFLLENLLGGESGPMADTILARMNKDASIGMVFPDDPYIVGWGSNLAFAEPLAARMGLEKLPEYFVFPVGTMFWSKASALAPLLDLNLSWDDYPEEPLPYDGSSLHALERLFSLILSLNNLRSAATNVMGLTR